MTIFNELYKLTLGATLTLTISADERSGMMTINVIPKPKTDHGEAALSTPLTLTASPEEFDKGFVEVLSGYRTEHRSLAEQAEATKELLQAAKTESAKKARGAVAKASAHTTAKSGATTPNAAEDAEDEGEGAAAEVSEPQAKAPASQGTELATEPQLFG